MKLIADAIAIEIILGETNTGANALPNATVKDFQLAQGRIGSSRESIGQLRRRGVRVTYAQVSRSNNFGQSVRRSVKAEAVVVDQDRIIVVGLDVEVNRCGRRPWRTRTATVVSHDNVKAVGGRVAKPLIIAVVAVGKLRQIGRTEGLPFSDSVTVEL